MARFRRRTTRGLTGRAASAFAPGESKRGKTLAWESLLNEQTPVVLNTFINNAVRTTGNFQINFRALIPINVSRGTVTLERIRGNIDVYFDSVELASNFENWSVWMQIQIAPARNGAFTSPAILSPANAADQESNKILWQRLYYPRAGTTITSPSALEVHESNYVGIEIDVKVKRRFDRAMWGLILVVDCESTAIGIHHASGTLRGLFRTGDGI